MGLLARGAAYDSVPEMDAACNDRYWDALTCALDGRDFAACYLLGYAIEMLLKTACFRFLGVPVTANLQPHLIAVRQQPRFRGVSLHDIQAWVDYLLDVRNRRGQPLDAALAGALVIRVATVAQHWSEVMRYRRAIPAADEANELHRQFEWLVNRYIQLWS
jgi:hypothetical protein